MATPWERPSFYRSVLCYGLTLACMTLAVASVQRHERVFAMARSALDGLVAHQAPPIAPIDAADLPAMHPLLAEVVDPRPAATELRTRLARHSAVQPFHYEPQPGDSLVHVATKFGVSLGNLLWNNGIESADDLPAGSPLTVLPVSGVLHHVEDGDSPASVAERYGAVLSDLIAANALDARKELRRGQVLVVPGGIAPLPTSAPTTVATAMPAAIAEAATAEVVATPTPVVEDLPLPKGVAPFQREFIMAIAPGARESQRLTGVPASVTLAQAILESDWGRSRLAREAKNLFGIKAHTRPGTAGVYNILAWEVINGADVMSPESFKAYKTMADSITDHGRWFHEQPRYAGALAVRDDPQAFARAINAAGYATDPAYSAKLIGLMDRFDLYAYDVE